MRKLSEIKGKDALDVLANIIDDVSIICADEDFTAVRKSGNRVGIVQFLLRQHGDGILRIMAALEGVDPGDYRPSLLEIPAALLELVNDKEFISLFRLGGTVTSSLSAMASTEATGTGRDHSSGTFVHGLSGSGRSQITEIM